MKVLMRGKALMRGVTITTNRKKGHKTMKTTLKASTKKNLILKMKKPTEK